MLAKNLRQRIARLLIIFVYPSLSLSPAVAADPPIIDVSPNSFDEHIYQAVSPTAELTLTITNNGGSDLEWSVIAFVPSSTSMKTYVLPPLEYVPDTGQTQRPSSDLWTQSEPMAVELLDLTGVRILYRGYYLTSDYSYLVNDLISRGASLTRQTLDLNLYSPQDYDLYWIAGLSGSPSINTQKALRNWLAHGNCLVLWSEDLFAFNTTMLAIEGGMFLGQWTTLQGFTDKVSPHETTANVDSILVGPGLVMQDVEPPADSLINDLYGLSVAAYSYVRSGRVIGMGVDLWADLTLGFADNRLFANQAFDWLALSVNWLRFSSTAGIVAPGSTQDLTVHIVADSLAQGDYMALIHISSNDPSQPEIDVPVNLRVDPYICGDINADGQINISDLEDFRHYYFACGPEPHPVASSNVDCDSQSGIADLLILAKYLYSIGTLHCCD